jgi:hypothetical protein
MGLIVGLDVSFDNIIWLERDAGESRGKGKWQYFSRFSTGCYPSPEKKIVFNLQFKAEGEENLSANTPWTSSHSESSKPFFRQCYFLHRNDWEELRPCATDLLQNGQWHCRRHEGSFPTENVLTNHDNYLCQHLVAATNNRDVVAFLGVSYSSPSFLLPTLLDLFFLFLVFLLLLFSLSCLPSTRLLFLPFPYLCPFLPPHPGIPQVCGRTSAYGCKQWKADSATLGQQVVAVGLRAALWTGQTSCLRPQDSPTEDEATAENPPASILARQIFLCFQPAKWLISCQTFMRSWKPLS